MKLHQIHTAGCSALRTAAPTLAGLAVAAASSLLLVLGGCASPGDAGPTARRLDPAAVGVDAAAAPAPALDAQWWRAFGDPALDALVERALAAQPSLQVAQARLTRAQAGAAAARAGAEPRVDAGVDATRQRYSAHSIYPPPLGGSVQTLATGQISASWEIDFFGKHAAAIAAAAGAERAAQADLAAARVVLAANVARTWSQLGRLHEQRAIAERALAQRQELLTLVQQRVQGGLDTNVELRQGEGALPEVRAQIEQIDEQIALARHALAALTAQPPAALAALTAAPRPVRALPWPAAVPADLLGRRADVAAARWRIEAATRDVDQARTLFYPDVDLRAFVGVQSIGLDRLLRSGSEQYGVGPALRLPVFDAGRLRANLRARSADLDAAVEAYNGAVLESVHEAADALASQASVARQQQHQSQAHASAEAAYDLATQRYRAGLGSYLVVLNAEAAVLQQRRAAADLRARAVDSQIALIRALGGGYAADPTPIGGYAPNPTPSGGYATHATPSGGHAADAGPSGPSAAAPDNLRTRTPS